MTITRIARPPKDLESFIGRKWLESLTLQSTEISTAIDSSFLVLEHNAELANARRFVVSSDLVMTDGGAGGDLSLSLSETGVVAGTYTKLTVDENGRVTVGAAATTTDIPEGTNLYYTDARVIAATSAVYIPLDGSGVTTASIPFAQGASIPAGEQITLGTDFFLKVDSLPPPFGQISLGYDLPGVGLGGFSAVFDSVAMSVDNSFTGGAAAFNVWDDSGVGRADLTSGIFRINYGTPPTGVTQVYGDITTFDDLIIDTATADRLLYTNGTKVASSVTLGNSLSFSAGTLDTIQDIRTSATPTFRGETISHATTATLDLVSGAGDDYSIKNASGTLTITNSTDGADDLKFLNDGSYTLGRSGVTGTLNGKISTESGQSLTISGNITLKDAVTIAVGTTTGTKIGTATTQKLGFFNATPVVQITGSTDILASLVTLGLRAASSNPPLNMGTGALTCGNVSCRQITIADANNIVLATTTGTKIGTGTTQKLGFWNATPIVRPSAYTQTYSTADKTLSAYTSDPESSAYTGIDNLQVGTPYAQLTDLNALRVAYENLRAFTEDLAAFVNAIVDDGQSMGLWG